VRVLGILLALFLAVTPAEAARVYVIYGQGGAITSLGMVALASRLEKIPGLTVSTHPWEYPGVIVSDIRALPKDEPVILIGYSLGAGMTTYIAAKVPRRKIALAVAYDPSVWAPPLPAGPNVQRLLLYKNEGHNIYGRASISGRQVETTRINEGHMMVPFDQALHTRTIAAVRRVLRR
jgi:pimeloyl-ACP methyl ester carboxylesterase